MKMIDDYDPDETFEIPPVPHKQESKASTGLFDKLSAVQAELKVPKGRQNDFGNYSYRSCEDIMVAAKQVLPSFRLCLFLTDALEHIGDRYYIKATATIVDMDTGERHSVTALAREQSSKKKMDEAQVTGAASSYARKYALSGLFCLDDERDPDSQPPEEASPKALICKTCGKVIEGTTRRDGSYLDAKGVAAATNGLCASCAKAARRG